MPRPAASLYTTGDDKIRPGTGREDEEGPDREDEEERTGGSRSGCAKWGVEAMRRTRRDLAKYRKQDEEGRTRTARWERREGTRKDDER